MLMVDIDDFKKFNDSVGHQAGDRFLVEVGAVLAEVGNRPGDLVARFGGEEFLLVFTETDGETAWRLAERIRVGVEGLGIVNPGLEAAGVVTVSIGAASAVAGPRSAWQDLVSRADRALYRAKAGGKNRVLSDGQGSFGVCLEGASSLLRVQILSYLTL